MNQPYQITLNLLSEPYGVDKENLLFSFAIPADQSEKTEAFRFAFALSLNALQQENYVYDTGWVFSSATTGICLEHLADALQEDQLYCCSVQVKFQTGAVSAWSAPFWFSTAPKDWNPLGVWCESLSDFCLLRKEFSLNAMPQKALLQISARSPEEIRQYIYHVFCNGQFVSLGPARYGKAEKEILYYETLDITPWLQEGINCLGAACYTTKEHCFSARLALFDAEGNKRLLFSDATDFMGMDATEVYRPQQSIGTNYFFAHGENINGERYPHGWNMPGYPDGFAPVCQRGRLAETMRLCPYPAPPVKREAIPASGYEVLEDGTWFVDLGKEIIGGIAVTAHLDEPCEVTMHYGEELTPQGRVRYAMRTTNVYEEHWRLAAGTHTLTSLGMKTFRYLEISGLPENAEVSVKGMAYQTPFDQTASYFTSSSELLNEIYDVCKYSIQATNQNLYVDSQSRERCAYEGDVLINMLTAAGVEDCHALSRFSIDYLLTHRTWPAEYVLYCIIMARADYEYTGNTELIARQYELLCQKLYLPYWNEQLELFENITMAGNVTDAVLVDWPASERDGYAYDQAIYNTVFNSVHYRGLADLAFLAETLHKPEDAQKYRQMAERLKKSMIQRLYDPEQGCFLDGLTKEGQPVAHAAQHATAFALYAGVYDSKKMQQQMAGFLEQQGEIRMSVYGAHFLLEGLYAAGAGKFANELLLNDDVSPGARTWAYMLDKSNATITTEAWNTQNKPNMTFSHPWGSAAGAAIVRGIFGIKPTKPGFREFSLAIQPEGLRYAAIKVPTVKGPILAGFDTTGVNGSVLRATIPGNAVAHISFPCPAGGQVLCNGQPLQTNCENGCFCWSVGSGEFIFEIG